MGIIDISMAKRIADNVVRLVSTGRFSELEKVVNKEENIRSLIINTMHGKQFNILEPLVDEYIDTIAHNIANRIINAKIDVGSNVGILAANVLNEQISQAGLKAIHGVGSQSSVVELLNYMLMPVKKADYTRYSIACNFYDPVYSEDELVSRHKNIIGVALEDAIISIDRYIAKDYVINKLNNNMPFWYEAYQYNVETNSSANYREYVVSNDHILIEVKVRAEYYLMSGLTPPIFVRQFDAYSLVVYSNMSPIVIDNDGVPVVYVHLYVTNSKVKERSDKELTRLRRNLRNLNKHTGQYISSLIDDTHKQIEDRKALQREASNLQRSMNNSYSVISGFSKMFISKIKDIRSMSRNMRAFEYYINTQHITNNYTEIILNQNLMHGSLISMTDIDKMLTNWNIKYDYLQDNNVLRIGHRLLPDTIMNRVDLGDLVIVNIYSHIMDNLKAKYDMDISIPDNDIDYFASTIYKHVLLYCDSIDIPKLPSNIDINDIDSIVYEIYAEFEAAIHNVSNVLDDIIEIIVEDMLAAMPNFTLQGVVDNSVFMADITSLITSILGDDNTKYILPKLRARFTNIQPNDIVGYYVHLHNLLTKLNNTLSRILMDDYISIVIKSLRIHIMDNIFEPYIKNQLVESNLFKDIIFARSTYRRYINLDGLSTYGNSDIYIIPAKHVFSDQLLKMPITKHEKLMQQSIVTFNAVGNNIADLSLAANVDPNTVITSDTIRLFSHAGIIVTRATILLYLHEITSKYNIAADPHHIITIADMVTVGGEIHAMNPVQDVKDRTLINRLRSGDIANGLRDNISTEKKYRFDTHEAMSLFGNLLHNDDRYRTEMVDNINNERDEYIRRGYMGVTISDDIILMQGGYGDLSQLYNTNRADISDVHDQEEQDFLTMLRDLDN